MEDKIEHVIMEESLTKNSTPVVHLFADDTETAIWLEETFNLEEDWVSLASLMIEGGKIHMVKLGDDSRYDKWKITTEYHATKCLTMYMNIKDDRCNIDKNNEVLIDLANSNNDIVEQYEIWRIDNIATKYRNEREEKEIVNEINRQK